jgi:hypothetical protein
MVAPMKAQTTKRLHWLKIAERVGKILANVGRFLGGAALFLGALAALLH